jgi:hypothetical protein
VIDPTTGALLLAGDVALTPAMGKAAFFATPPGASSTPARFNPPWEVFWFKAAARDGTPLSVQASFEGGALKEINLVHDVGPDVSEEETLRLHDAWLLAMLGPPPYVYPWGTVGSLYDRRSDASSILVVYGPKTS